MLNFDGTQEQGGLPSGTTFEKDGVQATFPPSMHAFIERQKLSGSPADMVADAKYLAAIQAFADATALWKAHYGDITGSLHALRVWCKANPAQCGVTLETV